MSLISIVHHLKADLESRGEYVVLANISSGWFAIFPRTWELRCEAARRNGREGPDLIVYRTKSSDPRDHHVIPYAIVRELLNPDTLTRSEVNGSERWNVTLRNSRLHVTHREGSVEVSQYYGALLLGESIKPATSPADPSGAIEETTFRGILEGIAREMTVMAKSRSKKLRDHAMSRSKGICECCGTDFAGLFNGRGLRALQVHHKQQLALRDEPQITSPNDLAVVCATCHAVIHSDPKQAISIEEMQQLWADEALRRRDEVRSSLVKTIPGPEALAQVRRAIAR